MKLGEDVTDEVKLASFGRRTILGLTPKSERTYHGT